MPKAMFISRIREQRIVMEPSTPIFDGGRRISDTQSRVIHFVNGRYETEDPDEIGFLRSRISAPDGPEGLTEVDPQAFAPDPNEVLAELVTLPESDVRIVLEQEQASHQRPIVIDACKAKLAQFAELATK